MFKLKNKTFVMALSVVVIMAGISLVSLPEWYLVSMGRSLALQISVAALALASYLLIRRQWILSLSFVLTGLLAAGYYYPYLGTAEEPDTAQRIQPDLKIAHFNVLKFSRNFDKTIGRALDTNADFISFQEIDSGWADALKGRLTHAYPYYKVIERESCCYGLAVFSKFPLMNTKTLYWYNLPNISGEIMTPGGKVNFVTSHTKSPTSYGNFRKRNAHLQELAEYLREVPGPVLSIGDFNAVPWDRHMLIFKRRSKLIDSRKAYSATYPSMLGFAGIPIDYIFHSSGLQCLDFKTVGGTASDHQGVMGTYCLTNHNS